jgi:hypothetical protein
MNKIKIIRCNVSDDDKILFIFSGLENYNGNSLLAEQLMKKLTNNYDRYFNSIPSFDFRNKKISIHNTGIYNNYDTETYLWILYKDAEEYISIIKDFIYEIENPVEIENFMKINAINLIINIFGNKIIK